jgi:hypothetical protein
MPVLLGKPDGIRIQSTVDLYNLSDLLHTFGQDYYPFHLSLVQQDLVGGTFTSNVPIEIEHRVLLGGSQDLSYLHDFY